MMAAAKSLSWRGGGSSALEWLVGGEQHEVSLNRASVDDLVEDVGGIVAIGEITDLVADEDGGLDTGLEGGHEAALTASPGEIVDEGGGGW